MTKSLFLVRGHEVEGENQDLFVVADGPDEAAALWNTWCTDNGFARNWNDEGDANDTYDPENIRCIVKDVTGTEYDGKPSRAVEWDELTIVA